MILLLLMTATDPCPRAPLRLDEASPTASLDESAIFKRDWEPTLQDVATCLTKQENRYACVVVQGQFDELKFDKKITGVFGGVSAVQATRARSRSDKVVAWLLQNGVRGEQVRTTPPPTWPTFRGAQLAVELDCLPHPESTAQEMTRLLRDDPKVAAQFREAAQVSSSQPVWEVKVQAPTEPKEPPRNFAFAEGGIDLPLTFMTPNVYTTPGLRLGGGWFNAFLLVKAGAQLSVGSIAEQRLGGGASLSAQYRILDWLGAGVGGRFSIGGPSPSAPWLEQYWGLGIESEQCPVTIADKTRVCVTEAFFPLGARVRRGEVSNGVIQRINTTTDYQLRAEIGAQVRRSFW